MSNPGRILNKWLTFKKKFEEHKKFKEVKDGPRHKLGIRNSLKELTRFTPKQLEVKQGQEDFEATKTQAASKLKKFCRVIKGSKDGDAKAREDFLKKTKQLTVVVLALDFKTVDLAPVSESTTEPTNDLDTVDVAALDRELSQPEREEGPTPPKDDRPADQRFKAILQQARELYLRLEKVDRGQAQKLLGFINNAMALAKKAKYEEGILTLSEVVANLSGELGTGTVAPKLPTTVPNESTTEWKKRIDLKKCSLGKELARGGQGAVIRLSSTDPNAPKLIGKIPLPDIDLNTGLPILNPKALEEMRREQEVYKKVGDHPNIVKCLGVQKVGGQDTLVLEAIDGKDMNKALSSMRDRYQRGQVSHEQYWGTMQYTMRKTLEALDHMKKKGLVHHDIKPHNIMLDGTTGEVKVIDMGGATEVGGHAEAYTYGFAAPDFITKGKVGGKADVFSVGATTYLAGEKQRFDYNKKGTEDDDDEVISNFGKGGQALHKGGGTEVDSRGQRSKVSGRYEAETQYTEFVNWLMNPDPSKRPSAEEALKHPFLAQPLLDEDSVREFIKDSVKPKPEVPPAPKTPEDKAAGKKIDKGLASVAALEKAGRKMIADAEAERNTVLKALASPTGTEKEKAKLQDQLKKSSATYSKYLATCQKWVEKNNAEAEGLQKLKDGLMDPVVWDAYDLKIEKALDHLRDCEGTLQGTLEMLQKQIAGTTPPPPVMKVEDLMAQTEEKLAQSANLRKNLAALIDVFTKQSQAFQTVAKQSRTKPEERKAYREKRLKYIEILGVLTGKAAGFVDRFAAMIAELEEFGVTWKQTPMPSDKAQKTRAGACVKNLVQEVATARAAQTELLKTKTQIATDAKAYENDPLDPG
jgi:serine/threonine protein kinase